MPFLIDLLLLALISVPLFLGWRRGFFRSVLSLGRLAISFLLTTLLGPTAGEWLNDRFIYAPVHASIHGRLSTAADEIANAAHNGAETLMGKVPTVLRPYLDLEKIDPSADVHALADTWSRVIAARLSHVLATAMGYALVFALAFLLLTVAIIAISHLIRKIPVIRVADRALGLTLGALIGCLGALLLSSFIAALLTASGQTDVVETSLLLRLSAGVRETFLR